MTRRLIVNADDLGLSHGVNAGIAKAHDDGIVTSASLMVRQPAAEAAATWARDRPDLSLGLHLDLCEWRPCGRSWGPAYERCPLDDVDCVATETDAQLGLFGELVGRPPTHVDSHQHVHRRPAVCAVVAERAARLGVPLRECSDVGYVGGFYGQDARGRAWPDLLTAEALLGILDGLGPGWSELGCHPGFAEDTGSTYRDERRREVDVLCDTAVRTWLDGAGIELATFGTER